jgi:competence ComEA-like helix-hairpin-helix protein
MLMGFLTKEERLVFLTLSVCLIAGGLFQLVSSLFELPEAIRLPSEEKSSVKIDGFPEANLPADELDRTGDETGSDAAGIDGQLTHREDGKTPAGKGSSSRESPSNTKAQRLSGKLDINKATSAELEALPGIGPGLAARIVEQRRIAGGFRSVEDLLTVRGIGEKTLAKFRQWVYVSSPR